MAADPPAAHLSAALASTEGRGPAAAFAVGDVELFDVDAVPFTTAETRTVGELLLDVDHHARRLLLDVEGDDAAALVRAWPTLIAAAEEFWTVLPRSSFPTQAHERPMERLSAYAVGINQSLATGWPGQGDPDARLADMAQTLRTAAGLVRRYAPATSGHSAAARQDLETARTRTIHALHLATHGVTVALHAYGRTRYHEAREAGRKISLSTVRSPYAIAPIGVWVGRFGIAETITSKYLHQGDRSLASVANPSPPVHDPHRVPRALAAWEIQAHRTLAARNSAADNVTVSRTQGLTVSVALLLLDADQRTATSAGTTETTTGAAETAIEPLSASLDSLGRAWNNLASRWDDLTTPTDQSDAPLLRAAAEVRSAYRELTHDTTSTLSPAVIAGHPSRARALDATVAAIETGAGIAAVLAEKAHEPGLVGRARALSRRAHNDIEAGLATPDPAGDVVWISPSDIHRRRMLPLPGPVSETLHRGSSLVVSLSARSAAAALASAATRLPAGAPEGVTTTVSEPRRLLPRIPAAPGTHQHDPSRPLTPPR